MSWITNLSRPKVDKNQSKDSTAELWRACGSCQKMLFLKTLASDLWVCHHCGHHLRIPAKMRLDMVFDEETYEALEAPQVPDDPLTFRDLKKYSDRLKVSRAKTGLRDVIVSGYGHVHGHACVVSAMDFFFMGGSMGRAVGEGFLAAIDCAVERKVPFVVFPSSGGARMQEGVLSLMQMVRTTIGVQKLREAKLPFVAFLTDPTTGGVFASFGMLGDFAFAEPNAFLALSGTRVLSGTTAETLPPGFQRTEYVLSRGMIDAIVLRSEQKDALANVFAVWKKKPNAPHCGV